MHKNGIQKPNCLDMSHMTSGLGISQMSGFVASKKDNQMVKLEFDSYAKEVP